MNEFAVQGPYLRLAQSIGLLVGAAFWGTASDVWGRKCVTFVYRSFVGMRI